MNETQRLNSLLRTYFSPSIIDDHSSPEGVEEVSKKAYSKLSSAMKGIKKHPAKDTP